MKILKANIILFFILFLTILHGSFFLKDNNSKYIYSDSEKYMQDIISFKLNKDFSEIATSNNLPVLYPFLSSLFINIDNSNLELKNCEILKNESCNKVAKIVRIFNYLCFIL